MTTPDPTEAKARQLRKARDGRIPPHNLAAEESLLGALLLNRQAQEDTIPTLASDDFYKPQHQFIFDAIRTLWLMGSGTVDAVTVAEELRRAGLTDESGGAERLMELQNATPAISNVGQYAKIVLETAQLRRLLWISVQIADRVFNEDPIEDIIWGARSDLALVELRGGSWVETQTGTQFMANPPRPYDWVMPFVLERDDRLLITGGEGSGKTMMLMQLAVMTACGAHWWTGGPVPPKRVLFLDLEIGELRSRRRSHLFENEANHSNARWLENLTIRSKAEDVDITTRAGASWLASIVEASGCDVMFIGPIYRLTSGLAKPGDIGGEDKAKQAAFALDRIRERYNCALVAETHAAKGDASRSRDLRPFGSSVWTRWPDFGYGLARQSPDHAHYSPDNREWVSWRGDRDPREWPSYFTRTPLDAPDWWMRAEYERAPSWMRNLNKGIFEMGLPSKGRPQQTNMVLDDEVW